MLADQYELYNILMFNLKKKRDWWFYAIFIFIIIIF